jgi:hypothetical protein
VGERESKRSSSKRNLPLERASASRAAFESLLMDLRPTDRISFGSRRLASRTSGVEPTVGASQVVRSQVRVIAAVERRSRRSGRRRTSIVDDDELGEDSARGVRIENGANESSERRANEPNSERATNATLNSIIRLRNARVSFSVERSTSD